MKCECCGAVKSGWYPESEKDAARTADSIERVSFVFGPVAVLCVKCVNRIDLEVMASEAFLFWSVDGQEMELTPTVDLARRWMARGMECRAIVVAAIARGIDNTADPAARR